MIVVTGGAGFIGSMIIQKLNQEGLDDILIVDEATPLKLSNISHLKFRDIIHKNDFIQTIKSGTEPRNASAIIHMGACSSTTETNRDYLTANNVEYSKTLALWAVQRGIRLIYASSAATYGNGDHGFSDEQPNLTELKPLNPYGESKHAFDVWAQSQGLFSSIVGLKFFNVYGPNEGHKGPMMSMVTKAKTQIETTGKIKLFKSSIPGIAHGDQTRDFIYVKDCADRVWWLLQTPNVAGLFNCGTGTARTWNDLAKGVFHALHQPVRIEYIDMPTAIKHQYQSHTEAIMHKFSAVNGPPPRYTLEAGITDTIRCLTR
jgi:ADP-L-glycero-D-manno-heptose 6-epimerase